MDELLKKIEEYSKAISQKFLDCTIKSAISKKLLFNEQTFDKKSNLWKTGFSYIRFSLFNDYVSSIANLIKDQDEKVASIANIIKIIDKTESYIVLKDKFTKPIEVDKIHIISDSSEEEKEQMINILQKNTLNKKILEFDEIYNKFLDDGKKLLDSELSINIYNYRCKIISHFEMQHNGFERKLISPNEFDIKWDDPYILLKDVEQSINNLYTLVFQTRISMDIFHKEAEESANLIYSSFLK